MTDVEFHSVACEIQLIFVSKWTPSKIFLIPCKTKWTFLVFIANFKVKNINLTCNIMKCHKCHHAIIYSSMYSTTVVALRYAAHCLYFLYFRPHSPQPYVSSACRLGQTQFPFLMFWPCSNDAVICMPSSWSCLVVFNAHISNSSNNMVELNWQRQSKYCLVNLIT